MFDLLSKKYVLLNFESFIKIDVYVLSTQTFDFRDFTYYISTSIIR